MYLLALRFCRLWLLCFSVRLKLQNLALQMPLSCLPGFCELLLSSHQDAGAALSASNCLRVARYLCKLWLFVIAWPGHCKP